MCEDVGSLIALACKSLGGMLMRLGICFLVVRLHSGLGQERADAVVGGDESAQFELEIGVAVFGDPLLALTANWDLDGFGE